MPRLTKIYTRKGDEGVTSLGGGQRVSKGSLRVQAYGTVDELNSLIGLAIAQNLNERLTDELTIIQNELLNLGSDLSFLKEQNKKHKIPRIGIVQVDKLEKLINELAEAVGPLRNFILPGGSVGAAYLHVARSVCRRAERETIKLSQKEDIGEFVIPYLNRLSDALFMMARFENLQQDIDETLWDPKI